MTRLAQMEANPLYWYGRAKVRSDYARDLAHKSASDGASDEVRNEYRIATEYERRAQALGKYWQQVSEQADPFADAISAANRGDLRPLAEYEPQRQGRDEG